MPIVDPKRAYISQAVYLASNVIDKRVRYKQELAEGCFGSAISSQSQQTNLSDDDDPAQPRIIFQAPHKQLLLTQIASQLVLSFETRDKSVAEQCEIITKNVKDVHSRIAKFKPQTELKENALVTTLSFPSDASREDLGSHIYNKLISLSPISTVASTGVKIGFELKNKIYQNIEIDVYEKRRGEIKSPMTFIDINSFEIVETGISVKLDFNNKLQSLEPGYSNPGPAELLELFSQYIQNDAFSILGFS